MGGNKDKDGQNKQDQFKHGDYDEKPSILSWKDHRGILLLLLLLFIIIIIIIIIIYYWKGGQIAEYLSTQKEIDGGAKGVKVTDPQLLQRNSRVLTENEIQKGAASPDNGDSPSPQWGFYVSITPDQQHFAKPTTPNTSSKQ